eukprot:TRINITY_DN77594_c0_g1_i1.p1 TRINITY_DN77594_c0_g1~~TRINITY_DN77594_c0_g1_i1.p1  ORF type:complete len:1029 (+),score=253.40 TRINITY_DN77594_c0_g1_i1:31-3117(+)
MGCALVLGSPAMLTSYGMLQPGQVLARPLQTSSPSLCKKPCRQRGLVKATQKLLAPAGALAVAMRGLQRHGRVARHLRIRGAALQASTSSSAEELRSEVRGLLELKDMGQVEPLLEKRISAGEDPAACVAAVLEELLKAGALRAALRVYDSFAIHTVTDETSRLALPEEVRGKVLWILASAGQCGVAVAHVKTLLQTDCIDSDSAARLFNRILAGIVEAEADAVQSSTLLFSAMVDSGVTPTSETLRLVVEAKASHVSPGFLKEIGESALEFTRRFVGAPPSGPALLAIGAAHLRGGDLDAAYRWFLASQLVEGRQELSGRASGEGGQHAAERALELVSQLVRALALGGHVRRMLRVLRRVSADGGVLPPCVASVSLAGYTCGRTLATCWLEPSAEVTRRRALWASSEDEDKLRVTCADQWDWPQMETSRHEIYQWSPYLAPDTKPERAWLAPLRLQDRGALGLARDWSGESPAAAAARERLGESPSKRRPDISTALQLEPPHSSSSSASKSVSTALPPKPCTWRAHHADVVKRAFLTPARLSAPSPEHSRRILMSEQETRLLAPDSKLEAPPLMPLTKLKELVSNADGTALKEIIDFEADDKKKKGKEWKPHLIQLLEGLEVDIKRFKNTAKTGKLEELVLFARRFAMGEQEFALLTDEEYLSSVKGMPEDELQRLWKARRQQPSTEVFGDELFDKVEEKLLEELREDEELEGSAEDELTLALEIVEALRKVGARPSSADITALCAAGHALANAELAAKVLKALAGDLQTKASASSKHALGPSGQIMVEAMTAGGWQREAAEGFLRGERALPARDPKRPGTGDKLTRYLDPLQGLGNSSEELLPVLAETWDAPVPTFRGESKKRQADSQDEARRRESIEYEVEVSLSPEALAAHEASVLDGETADMNPLQESIHLRRRRKVKQLKKKSIETRIVSRKDVLMALLRQPIEARKLERRALMFQKSKNEETQGLIDVLGFESPRNTPQRKLLCDFIFEVSEEVERTRRSMLLSFAENAEPTSEMIAAENE